jgi:hypothetical protein
MIQNIPQVQEEFDEVNAKLTQLKESNNMLKDDLADCRGTSTVVRDLSCIVPIK